VADLRSAAVWDRPEHDECMGDGLRPASPAERAEARAGEGLVAAAGILAGRRTIMPAGSCPTTTGGW
jgi:hypothetical protein